MYLLGDRKLATWKVWVTMVLLGGSSAEDEEPVVLDRRLARQTTKKLVGRIEGVAILAQAIWIVSTATVDRVTPTGQYILYVIAGIHIVGAALAFIKGGPFVRGGPWMMIWIGTALTMPLVMANLVPFGAYGSTAACVQLCGYPVPPVIFVAFYPWIRIEREFLRPGLDVALLAAIVIEPLILILATNERMTPSNWASWVVSSSLYLLAYAVGKGVGAMCRTATIEQLKAQRAAFREFYNLLHDNVESTLGAVEGHFARGDYDKALEALRGLDAAVKSERVTLELSDEQVYLPKIVEIRASEFAGVIPELNVEPAGGLTARRPVATLINRALGALLKNVDECAKRGRINIAAKIALWSADDFLCLEVADNGPGFSAEVLNDPRKNLGILRQRARELGGDLVMVDRDEPGAQLQLWVPLHSL